jgi:hypothetical protein
MQRSCAAPPHQMVCWRARWVAARECPHHRRGCGRSRRSRSRGPGWASHLLVLARVRQTHVTGGGLRDNTSGCHERVCEGRLAVVDVGDHRHGTDVHWLGLDRLQLGDGEIDLQRTRARLSFSGPQPAARQARHSGSPGGGGEGGRVGTIVSFGSQGLGYVRRAQVLPILALPGTEAS